MKTQTTKTEYGKINTISNQYNQRIGSTVYEVHIRFDTAKAELLEDKILRLIKRDLEFGLSGQIRAHERKSIINSTKNNKTGLPQADRLPERGLA